MSSFGHRETALDEGRHFPSFNGGNRGSNPRDGRRGRLRGVPVCRLEPERSGSSQEYKAVFAESCPEAIVRRRSRPVAAFRVAVKRTLVRRALVSFSAVSMLSYRPRADARGWAIPCANFISCREPMLR